MGARIGIVLGLATAEVLQLGLWLFARFATLDHPERVEAADRMTTLLGLGLVILPVGFLACLAGGARGFRVAATCAGASILLAVAAVVIGAAGFGAPDPVVGAIATFVPLAVPGLILLVCALAVRRAAEAARPS